MSTCDSASVKGDIVSFLEYLYQSVAETLPDFRDELGNTSAVKVDVADPYAEKLHAKGEGEKIQSDLAPPRKKPRKTNRQVVINQSRKEMEERFLPPGTMKEFFDQYVLQSALSKPGSFPTFWRVSWFLLWVVLWPHNFHFFKHGWPQFQTSFPLRFGWPISRASRYGQKASMLNAAHAFGTVT